MMKTILLIHTGGTISMQVQMDSGAVVLTENNPLTLEAKKLQQYANIIRN